MTLAVHPLFPTSPVFSSLLITPINSTCMFLWFLPTPEKQTNKPCQLPYYFFSLFSSKIPLVTSSLIVSVKPCPCASPFHHATEAVFVVVDSDLHIANSDGHFSVLSSALCYSRIIGPVDYSLLLITFSSFDCINHTLSRFSCYLTSKFCSPSPLQFFSLQPEFLIQEYTRTQLLDFFLCLAHQFHGFKYHQYADYTQIFISNPDFSPKHQTSYIQLYVLNWASYILARICNVWALHISFNVNSILPFIQGRNLTM